MMQSTPRLSPWWEISPLIPCVAYCARHTEGMSRYSGSWMTRSFTQVNTSMNERKLSLSIARNTWKHSSSVTLDVGRHAHTPEGDKMNLGETDDRHARPCLSHHPLPLSE